MWVWKLFNVGQKLKKKKGIWNYAINTDYNQATFVSFVSLQAKAEQSDEN